MDRIGLWRKTEGLRVSACFHVAPSSGLIGCSEFAVNWLILWYREKLCKKSGRSCDTYLIDKRQCYQGVEISLFASTKDVATKLY